MRLHLLSGSRLVGVPVSDGVERLSPPPPVDPLADIGEAVVGALRYPLGGATLEQLVTPSGRATIVVEPPLLPVPGAPEDPRRDALAAVIDELELLGVAPERQTLLVAGGLERRAGRKELEQLLRPDRAREFRGELRVHDCEAEDLVPVGDAAGIAAHIAPALVETDLVITVGAAESVIHGGPATLLGASSPGLLRAASSATPSLLEPGSSQGWQHAVALEALLARRVPLIGVSLVLDLPRPILPRGPLRAVHNALPASMRRSRLDRHVRPLRATGILAGTPSVAHAEALIRGVTLRGIRLAEPLEAIVVPLPWTDAHARRERVNPITATAAALGIGLRLWRGAHPLREGGTVVLLHRFSRTIGHGPQSPYLPLFAALRDARPGVRLRRIEAAASRDGRAVAAYREGRAPHPRLPFADWDACQPALERAGRVIVAGCRDAGAARALGFVPSHSVSVALGMARGLAGDDGRVGVLEAPPYAPLIVG
ncbi:MAG: lactate racemase domain-containing protein [Gaiella sp.]